MSTLDNTVGAMFIGGLLTTVLFGITCIQAFHYYQGHTSDSRYLKVSVGFILLCDTAHMILMAQGLYWYMVTNFSNPSVLALASSSFAGSILVAAVSDNIIRIFFTRRIWILSGRSYALTLPLVSLIIVIFISGVALGVEGLIAITFKELETKYWLLRTTLALTVAGDLYIAICLCFLLHQARSGMKTTNSIVRNLMVYSINTGLLTGITSSACLATSIAFPETYIWVGICLPLSKFYCNAMLATLNARKALRSTKLVPNSADGIGSGVRSGIGESDGSKIYPLLSMNRPIISPAESVYPGYGQFSSKIAEYPDIEVRIDKEVHIGTDMEVFAVE